MDGCEKHKKRDKAKIKEEGGREGEGEGEGEGGSTRTSGWRRGRRG